MHPINWECEKLGGLQPGFTGLIAHGTLASSLSKAPLSQGCGTCSKLPFGAHPATFAWESGHPCGCNPSPFLLLTSSGFWPPCWNNRASTDSAVRHSTKSCSSWLLLFLLGFVCPGQEFPQSSCLFHIVLPRALICGISPCWDFYPRCFYRGIWP